MNPSSCRKTGSRRTDRGADGPATGGAPTTPSQDSDPAITNRASPSTPITAGRIEARTRDQRADVARLGSRPPQANCTPAIPPTSIFTFQPAGRCGSNDKGNKACKWTIVVRDPGTSLGNNYAAKFSAAPMQAMTETPDASVKVVKDAAGAPNDFVIEDISGGDDENVYNVVAEFPPGPTDPALEVSVLQQTVDKVKAEATTRGQCTTADNKKPDEPPASPSPLDDRRIAPRQSPRPRSSHSSPRGNAAPTTKATRPASGSSLFAILVLP